MAIAALLNITACDDLPTATGVSEAVDAPPASLGLVTLRSDQLVCAKARLEAGDIVLRSAFDRLIASADSALTVAPVSVTDKKRVPPSRDRHDYISLAPYWWPDPTKPDGLPYIHHDGALNPEANEDYDRPRLRLMLNVVNTLSLAYYFKGNELYAQHAATHLRTWFLNPATRMNPHLEYAQVIPGRNTVRGTGIIDTHDLPRRLLDGLALLEVSPHWTAFDQQRMRAWLAAFLDWLRTSEHGQQASRQPNNHGSWYDLQTAALALFLDQSAMTREIVRSSATRRIATQVEPDGSQPHELRRTLSLHYSVFNLRALMQLAELGRSVDIDLWHYEAPNGASIRVALDFLAPYADPARPWPMQQIKQVPSGSMLELLRMGEIAYSEPKYRESISLIPEHFRRDNPVQLLYPVPLTPTPREGQRPQTAHSAPCDDFDLDAPVHVADQ